jgi:hypothetical protein
MVGPRGTRDDAPAFGPVERARVLAWIVEDVLAASDEHTPERLLPGVERVRLALLLMANSADPGRLGLKVAELAATTQVWLDQRAALEGTHPDEIARAMRRLALWMTVVRLSNQPVPFDALLDAVLAEPERAQEIAGVEITTAQVRTELMAHSDAILERTRAAIDGVEQARTVVVSALLARFPEPPTGPRSDDRPLILRRLRPRAAVDLKDQAVDDAAHRPDPFDGLEPLQAHLAEMSATANAAVTQAIESEVRLLVNARSNNLRGTRLTVAATDGLSQVDDAELEIRTASCVELEALLRRMKGGSLGLAGPRGVGKSTLTRRFVEGRETFGDRDVLAVAVSAPVVYDSRDFMLHLFSQVCAEAGGSPPPLAREDGTATRSWLLRAWSFGLPALVWIGLTVALCGAAALVAALWGGSHDLLPWGVAALVSSAAAATMSDLWRPGAFNLPPVISGGMGLLASTTAIGLGAFGVMPDADVLRAAGVLVAGLLLLSAVGDSVRIRMSHGPGERRRLRPEPTWPPDDPLAQAASLRREEIQYQQSYTVGVNGTVGLPAGIELGMSSERSFARHPLSFPEVVDRFQRFLALAAESRDVLIAIDELDKLPEGDDTADRFLNDLKAVFGQRHIYFLVSVSEDAMSRFERRGLPFRDVFDSTFDEIVQVAPLRLEEAQALLARRVVGVPYIYSGLCHVLAGGVPRELIRMARRVVAEDQALPARGDLAAITAALVAREFEAKARAVEVASHAQQDFHDLVEPFYEWIGKVMSPADLRDVLSTLTEPEHAVMPSLPGVDGLEADGRRARRELLRLAAELLAYQYFMATVLEFFSRSFTEADVLAAARAAGAAPPGLEVLGRARSAFATSAQSAWRGVHTFREQEALSLHWTFPR